MARLLDTDDLARQLVQPGEPALREIQSVFGDGVISGEGQLRRDELARIVFADPSARQKLESILHPRIRNLWLAQIAIWRDEGHSLAVVVIPLLFETNAESQFDKIICAACLPVTQHGRLAARGWNPSHITQRIAAQFPIEQKIARSNYLVWTEGNLESAARQVKRIVVSL